MKINAKDKAIILNVDTGTDDAMAIILAYKYLNNIVGITTSAGNVNLEKVSNNTNKVLNLVGFDAKIYPGAKKDLKNEEFQFAENFHGDDGLMNAKLPLTKNLIEKESAIDFIIEQCHKHAGKIIIISLAPLTNVAKAIKKDPSISSKIDKLIIMGGTLEVEGNETPKSEFNFYQDPDSVEVVFGTDIETYLVTLDVTSKCLISEKRNKEFSDRPVGFFVKQMIDNWYHNFGRRHNRKYELYDPLTIAALIDDYIDFSESFIEISKYGPMRGVIKNGYGKRVFISKTVKSQNFVNFFIKAINSF